MRNRTRRLTIASATLAATAIFSGCGTTIATTGAATSTGKPIDPVIQDIAVKAGSALAARGNGKPSAAAYVVTTASIMSKGASDTDAFGRLDASDQLVVVRLYGKFVPDHSRPLGAPPLPAGVMTTVYDVTLGQTVMNSFDSATPVAGATGTTDQSLQKLGTPIALDIPSIAS